MSAINEKVMPWCVRVHCGSHYVRGNARGFTYFIAQLFMPTPKKDSVYVYKATGQFVGPFRSKQKTILRGRQLAEDCNAEFIEGYGSMHNTLVDAWNLFQKGT